MIILKYKNKPFRKQTKNMNYKDQNTIEKINSRLQN